MLFILIIPTIISIFFFWLSKRNERIKSELARYETLFGNDKKTGEDL